MALIPERLTYATAGDYHFEAWRTPNNGPGFHLYVTFHGVEIGKHPHPTEVSVRKAFEQSVEDHSNAQA